jgi:hypothetical protein
MRRKDNRFRAQNNGILGDNQVLIFQKATTRKIAEEL